MKKIKENKKFLSIFLRYLLIILLAIPNFYIFYKIFTPLTIYSSYFLFNLFFNALLTPEKHILIKEITIQIIPACVAGAAYYLLFALNLSIPDIKTRTRIKSIIFSFFALFIINVLRIFFLGLLIINNYSGVEFLHKFTWYFLSTLFVVVIWFLTIKIFKIKEIPFYTDLKFIYNKSNLKKQAKNKFPRKKKNKKSKKSKKSQTTKKNN